MSAVQKRPLSLITHSLPLLTYFSVVVCLRWLYHHMLSVSYISRKSWVLCLLLLCSLKVCANNRVHSGPMVLCFLRITQLQYHHYADQSQGIELLKCFLCIFCLVYPRISQFSQFFQCNIYGAARIQLRHCSYEDCENRENTCSLPYIIIKSVVCPICRPR